MTGERIFPEFGTLPTGQVSHREWVPTQDSEAIFDMIVPDYGREIKRGCTHFGRSTWPCARFWTVETPTRDQGTNPPAYLNHTQIKQVLKGSKCD